MYSNQGTSVKVGKPWHCGLYLRILLTVCMYRYVHTYICSGIVYTTPYNTQACMYLYVRVCACVHACNMLHMVGLTHHQSHRGQECSLYLKEGKQSLNTDHIYTYTLEETNNSFTTE